jgi:hypothetical protein
LAFSIISRSGWNARAPDSCTSQNPDGLLGVTVHHTASPRSVSAASLSAALVRGIQNFHMDTSPEGYVDIAYNFLFDKFGQIFTGRGWNCRSGANGTGEANRTHLSFCYLGHSDLDGFPELAQDACAFLIAEAFKKGVGRHVVPHSFWGTGTACPGNAARNWVNSGAWKADLPTAKRVRYEVWDGGERQMASTEAPIENSRDKLANFLQNHVGGIHKLLAEEGKSGDVRLIRRVLS